ncbi:MAG: FecR family protein [Candidatus Cloacimonadota bacterium]|nr:FecR family protein [Candidatus Cloacimonadota bacterium]
MKSRIFSGKKAFLVYMIVLLLGATFANLTAQSVNPFALILTVNGNVILNHEHNLQPAEVGSIIFDGDVIITKSNSDATIKFSDNGGLLKLFSNSTLTVDLSKTGAGIKKEMKLDSGEILSQIKTSIGNYSVITPTAVASVKGTMFLTSIDPGTGNTTINVYEGSVDLGNDNGIISIPAGNQGFSNGATIPNMEPMGNNQSQPVIQTQLTSNGESLSIPEPSQQTSTGGASSQSQQTSPKESAKSGVSKRSSPLNVGFGSVTIDGKMYTRIRLMPELSFWKFKLGFDFDILFDEDGNIRKEDWDDFNAYLNKILYLQFAERNDPFYARFGGFPSIKFGQGLIMRDYTNMLNYPLVRQLGAEVAVNTNIFGLGIDVFCPNIDQHNIFAGRIHAKPLTGLDIPILKNIKLGVTAATDLDQFSGIRARKNEFFPTTDLTKEEWLEQYGITHGNVSNPDTAGFANWYETNKDSLQIDNAPSNLGNKKKVTVIGADYSVPLISTKTLSLYHYGEFAQILDYGNGLIFPGFGAHFLIFDLNMDYRIFGDKFEANYFNSLYDDDRAIVVGDSIVAKSSLLENISKSTGWRGEVTTNLFNILSFSVAYEDMHGDDYDQGKSIMGELKLNTKMIPKITHAYARYSQTHAEKFAEWKTPYASINAQLGFSLNPTTVLLWDYREHYVDVDANNKIEGSEETITSTGISIQLKF